MVKWFILVGFLSFVLGFITPNIFDEDKHYIVVRAPHGYEIKSGYRWAYYTDKGELRWTEKMSFKEGHWQKQTRISGSGAIPENNDTLTNEYIFFIRKLK